MTRIRLLGIIAICGVVLGVTAVVALAQLHASHTATVRWSASTQDFTASDRTGITQALTSYYQRAAPGSTTRVIDAQRAGDDAVFTVGHGPGEPAVVLGALTNHAWRLWFRDSGGFCQELQSFPATLLTDANKQFFTECYS